MMASAVRWRWSVWWPNCQAAGRSMAGIYWPSHPVAHVFHSCATQCQLLHPNSSHSLPQGCVPLRPPPIHINLFELTRASTNLYSNLFISIDKDMTAPVNVSQECIFFRHLPCHRGHLQRHNANVPAGMVHQKCLVIQLLLLLCPTLKCWRVRKQGEGRRQPSTRRRKAHFTSAWPPSQSVLKASAATSELLRA